MPNLGKRHARVFQTVSLPYSANMLNSSWFFFLTSNIFLVYHPINIIGFLCTCLSDLHSYFIKETFFSSSSLKFKNLFNNYSIDYWFFVREKWFLKMSKGSNRVTKIFINKLFSEGFHSICVLTGRIFHFWTDYWMIREIRVEK